MVKNKSKTVMTRLTKEDYLRLKLKSAVSNKSASELIRDFINS